VVLLAAVLLLVAAPAARAAGEAGDRREAERRLEWVTAALAAEADRLELLSSGAGLGGTDWAVDVQAYLTSSEVRVWGLRVAASEALAWLLGVGVSVRVVAGESRVPAIPTLDPEAGEVADLAGWRPVLNDWAAYERALSRVLALEAALREAAAPGLAGLPPPGRTCPVAGPHSFTHTWGEERPWGRGHKGEDIHAPRDTPLVAMESGTIVQTGWHWSGGFGVYLEGYYSGDIYYYAHMTWTAPGIRAGAVVEVGELLGWVGTTGNADSPHLHLGWIPDNPGPWVDLEGLADPYPLVVGLCGGD